MSNKDNETKLPLVRLFANEAQGMAERVLSTCTTLDIEIPETTPELQGWLIESENQIARAMARQGFGFIALKEQLAHGEWLQWLESNGFKQQRVQEQIQVAEMLIAVPDDTRLKLYGLTGKKKLISLSTMEPEVVHKVASTGTVDELDQMSHAAVVALARKLQGKQNSNEQQAETQSKRSRHEAEKFKAENGFPVECAAIRNESTLSSQAVIDAIDLLHTVIRRSTGYSVLAASSGTEEDVHFAEIAGRTLFHHIRGVAAAANALLKEVSNWHYGDVSHEILLTESEIRSFLIAREDIMQAHKHAKASQQDAPKGRGRPRKDV